MCRLTVHSLGTRHSTEQSRTENVFQQKQSYDLVTLWLLFGKPRVAGCIIYTSVWLSVFHLKGYKEKTPQNGGLKGVSHEIFRVLF